MIKDRGTPCNLIHFLTHTLGSLPSKVINLILGRYFSIASWSTKDPNSSPNRISTPRTQSLLVVQSLWVWVKFLFPQHSNPISYTLLIDDTFSLIIHDFSKKRSKYFHNGIFCHYNILLDFLPQQFHSSPRLFLQNSNLFLKPTQSKRISTHHLVMLQLYWNDQHNACFKTLLWYQLYCSRIAKHYRGRDSREN